jgi:hypothetical protein
MKASFCIVVLIFGIFIASPFNAFAESYQQTLSTDKGSLKVGLLTIPEKPSVGSRAILMIDFLNSQSGVIQHHVDYKVSVTKCKITVFGPTPVTHIHSGTVTIPVEFKEGGEYKILVNVEGILFQVIPSEKVAFIVKIGEKQESSPNLKSSTTQDKIKSDKTIKTKSESKSVKNIKSNQIRQYKKQ